MIRASYSDDSVSCHDEEQEPICKKNTISIHSKYYENMHLSYGYSWRPEEDEFKV